MQVARKNLLKHRWTWIGIMLFLTFGLFVSSTLGWLWYAEKQAAAARQSSLDLLWMEQIITNKFETQQVMLQNWALDLTPNSTVSKEDFLQRINGIITENHAILAVDVIDEDYQRIIGFPEYIERPNHLPPLNDPLVTDAINHSQNTKSTAYSLVIEQFAPLWVMVIPSHNEHYKNSRILVTYDLDKLLTQEVPWWFIQRYDLSLVDQNDKQLSPSEGGVVAHSKNVNHLDFGPTKSGLSLKTSARAAQDFDTLLIVFSGAILVFGILIFWLLSILRRWLRERKLTKKALRERDDLLQYTARLSSLAEFASGIAHELNQPLAAIANYSAAVDCLLETHPIQSEKIKHAIEKMGEESRRAGSIMRSMRSFIQKNSNLHEPYMVNRLIDESIELIYRQAKNQNITIHLDSEIKDVMIQCDAVMLKQVLFNLLRNALEAMEDLPEDPKPILVIQVKLIDEFVHFSINDEGHGIVDIDKLFQSFYTTKSEGMGLGLAICRTVIENHGGKIWAENKLIGGAIFHFRLPLQQQ